MSKIFKPFRSLGKVCNEIPFVLRYHPYHKEVYIVVPVGRSLHTYALQHLAIKAISEELPSAVTAVAANNKVLLVAAGPRIFSLAFGRTIVREFRGGHAASPVRLLLNLGNEHFISGDEDGNVFVWAVEDSGPLSQLPLGRSRGNFTTSALLHPATYKNKVLLGSREGGLRLWNVRRNASVHDFSARIQAEVGAWDGIEVTCLAQGPAPHVVGIGREDGRVQVLHLKSGEMLREFRQEWGCVSSLTFRSDGVDQLLSGSSEGYVTIWRLETNRTVGGGDVWHQAAVTGLQCVHRHALVVSSSPDNRLKVWSYADSGPTDPEVRPLLLHRREGHSLPPSVLRYFGQQGDTIVSGGDDSSLRVFSTLHERFNRQLGRAYRWTAKSASGRKKQRRAVSAGILDAEERVLPAFCDLAVEPARSGDWDTVASCHARELQVPTWDIRKGTQGRHHLAPKLMGASPALHKKTTATCVTLSSCGNFCTIGYSSGHIVRFNAQSGFERTLYSDEDDPNRAAHRSDVRGLHLDQLDKQLTSAGGAGDGRLRVWCAKKGKLLRSVELDSPVLLMRGHREAESLALGLEDGSLLLLNSSSSAVVRRFFGHRLPEVITELAFFPDAKWLLSFGSQGSAKTWDLMDGKLIDCFLMPLPVRSAVMSPTADFLATAHVGELGIFLWSNRALFKVLSLTPLAEDLQLDPATAAVSLPTSSLRHGDLGEENEEAMEVDDGVPETFLSPEQLSEDLVTLSGVAESRWRHLLRLDTIRERNRPQEAVRAPEVAPFFLPAADADGRLMLEENGEGAAKAAEAKELLQAEEDDSEPKRPDLALSCSLSRLAPRLAGGTTAALIDAISFLESLGPSAVDLELQLLGSEPENSQLLRLFLRAVLACLKARRHFDSLQGYLALFLTHYGLRCAEDRALRLALEEVRTALDSAWDGVEEMADEVEVLCLIAQGKSPYSE